MLRVQPIERHHVPATADLVARAMDMDAAFRYLFTNAGERYGGLVRLFDRNLRIHLSRRCTYVALDSQDRVVGTATVRSPSFVPISTLTMLRRGLLPFAWRHGRRATRRLFWLKNTYDALERELAGHRPHWYVHMMAVQPEHQGRGVGSELLAQALSLAAGDDRNEKMVLTTHVPRNLVFYERARFETVWERTIDPPGGAPYSVWGMTRRTAAP
jgi:ribosomal protein S18 acetylase RimI-like enzyme